jgi:hypothetical protein
MAETANRMALTRRASDGLDRASGSPAEVPSPDLSRSRTGTQTEP